MLRIKTFEILLALLFIFFACPFNAVSQQYNFILKIHFKNLSVKTLGIGEAYFYKYAPLHAAIFKNDSSNAYQNTYSFVGTTLYPTAIRVFSMDTSVNFNQLVFIDTGYQKITIIKGDTSYLINAGIAIEREHKKFLGEMQIKTMDDKIDGEKLLSYVQNNPNSYIALFAIINQAFNYSYSPDFEKINDAFSEKIQQTKAFQYYLKLYSNRNQKTTDPNFLGKSLQGKKMFLKDVTGKGIVLFDFWASWCLPCLQEMPHLKTLYQKYRNKGFQIISISFDIDSTDWQKAIKKEGIQSWINLIAGQSNSLNDTTAVAKKYSIEELPTSILINKEGHIIGRYGLKYGSVLDLDKKIKKIFR